MDPIEQAIKAGKITRLPAAKGTAPDPKSKKNRNPNIVEVESKHARLTASISEGYDPSNADMSEQERRDRN